MRLRDLTSFTFWNEGGAYAFYEESLVSGNCRRRRLTLVAERREDAERATLVVATRAPSTPEPASGRLQAPQLLPYLKVQSGKVKVESKVEVVDLLMNFDL